MKKNLKCFRRDGRIRWWDAEVWSLAPPLQFWVSHGSFISLSGLGGCSDTRACAVVAVDPTGTVWFWGWQGVSKFTARSYSPACAWEPAKVLDLPCSGLSPYLTRNILGCELELQTCPEIFTKIYLWVLWSQGCAGPVFDSDSSHRRWPAHSPCWVWTSLLPWFKNAL